MFYVRSFAQHCAIISLTLSAHPLVAVGLDVWQSRPNCYGRAVPKVSNSHLKIIDEYPHPNINYWQLIDKNRNSKEQMLFVSAFYTGLHSTITETESEEYRGGKEIKKWHAKY